MVQVCIRMDCASLCSSCKPIYLPHPYTLPHLCRSLLLQMGHRAPLYRIVAMPAADFAVSVDTSGVFRWWDVRRSATVEETGTQVCEYLCMCMRALMFTCARRVRVCTSGVRVSAHTLRTLAYPQNVRAHHTRTYSVSSIHSSMLTLQSGA